MKRLFTDEIDNMRELGGYFTKDGKIIRYDFLIRSNLPKSLSEENINYLLDKKITTIIDLRNNEEIAKKPGVFYNSNLFRYNHVKIKGDGKIPDSPEMVYDSYVEMIEGKEEIGKVFNIIANADDGVLFYCNAGKDRTGVVSALILKSLGVKDKDIVLDYIASGIYLMEMLEEFANSTQIVDIKSIITPNPDTMFKVLSYVEKKYDNIENYLYSCGVTQKELKHIKKKAGVYVD